MKILVLLMFRVVFAEDFCAEDEGVWGPKLVELATGPSRQGKIIMIPISSESSIAKSRIDNGTLESKVTPGKIVYNNNNNHNNYNNQNNNNKRPLVTETDMYLLGAIEKLVYRVDFMEKRLRRVEEMLYYVMAGNRMDTVGSCAANFTRIGASCYLFGSEAGREYDWKVASKQCRRFKGILAEMETIEENQDLVAYIQNSAHLRGKDFWLGGLNPGLLWIWSNSARPVLTKNGTRNDPESIQGEGRCLRLAYNPGLRSYNYIGSDCSIRHSYVCELIQDIPSEEVKKIGRSLKVLE